jgi:shikimate dehydrogenase
MSASQTLKLGLIGDNIARSKSPLLHRLAGAQNRVTVQYDRLIPKDMGEDFDTVFDACATRGYRGINVTYPYKERAAKKVAIADPLVRAIGAVNTVLFEADGPKGHNTDYTGFISGYRGVRGDQAPGVACLIGTGGVGRALAFGLVALGATEIRLVDRDEEKAQGLARDLRAAPNAPQVGVYTDAVAAASRATGILNGTPVGMVGYGGTPLSKEAMAGAKWVFDAVYTPVDTQFLQDATAEGLNVISGYELFFFQGVHAWAHFSGLPLDEARLRADLLVQGEAA